MKSTISFEQLEQLEVRICRILSAERIENTDKLYHLRVHNGEQTLDVVSAIADRVTVEQLVNQEMPFVMNLAPRKIRGIESQAMIVMAESPSGQLVPITPTETCLGGEVF